MPDWLAELPRPSTTVPVVALGTALETDSGPGAGTPMLCMMVLTSYPPQCSGPELIGWDWSAVEHGDVNGVRFTNTDFPMLVTYDGPAHTITPVEMLPAGAGGVELPHPMSGDLDYATVEQLGQDLLALQRPDIFGFGGNDGAFQLDVISDDGSMQAAFDALFGAGNVIVTSWLVPAA